MTEQQAVRQEAFDDLQLTIIEQNGEEWLSAEDIGKALGLVDPRRAVLKIFRRNREEFEGLYRVTNLVTRLMAGGFRPSRFTTFNPQGAYLLAILARTEKSKALRRWLAKFMAQDLHLLKAHVAQLEAQRSEVDTLTDQLYKSIGSLKLELKKARKQLAEAPKLLTGPESPPPPNYQLANSDIVRLNFGDIKALVERGGLQPPYDYNFLHQLLNAQETPKADLEKLLRGIEALPRLVKHFCPTC